MEREFGPLHDGSNRDRELLPALSALVQAWADLLSLVLSQVVDPLTVGISTLGTGRTVGPANRFKVVPSCL